MFIDSHCHLYKEYYEDLYSVLDNAFRNNVVKYINCGCDRESNKEVIDTINRYDFVYGAIGIHPENVLKYSKEDILFIKNNLEHKKVLAIGEIGLDYHYTKEYKVEQKELFETQLQIAEQYDIPVIIHSRDATNDTIEILKKFHTKGIIHSFSGSFETASEYIKMGYLIGINGVVTFKNANLKEVVKKLPLECIVLETDSPYLTPEPFRGMKNNPTHIIDIAKYICELKNISMEELANITNQNLAKIFNNNLIND